MPLLILLSLFVISCNRPSADSPAAAGAEASTPSDWMVFEDDWFKVSYPSGSDVGGGPDGKQDPNFPTLAVVPPIAGDKIHGAFTLQFEKRTAGMLLRDAIQSEVQSGVKTRGVMISAPREIKVANGKCMSAIVSAPFDRCPKDSGVCFSPTVFTLCDDIAGRRFTAMTMLSRGKTPNTLSPQAQQEVAVYERILRSLEFKKS